MDIQKQIDGKKITVKVSGRLDTNTAPQLDAELKPILDEADELIFDFSELDYISSAGLRVLLSAQKNMNNRKGSMCVTGANEIIKEIFDVTGFSDIMMIE